MTPRDADAEPDCAAADPAPRAPRFMPPAGACDCHVHVFGRRDLYPYTPHRIYTPPPAPFSALQRMMTVTGLSRAVVIQPSVYGADNRATLDAVAAGGPAFRAVVVVDETAPEAELERMHGLGARGVRLNLLFRSGVDVSDIRRLADRIAPFGWHLQMLTDVSDFADLRATLGALPVDVVFDHMGHMPASGGLGNAGFREMLRMLRDGRAWAKLSGAYRITGAPGLPYADVAPFARAIIAANPQRALWASDWPHPSIGVPMPNDGALLDLLDDWAPDVATRDQILRDNPARLYGFDATDA